MNNVLFSSASDEWSTPDYIFDELNNEFHFTLDPCASDSNHKCNFYFTKDDNGLLKSWSRQRVFCNPPYSRNLYQWIKKARDEVFFNDCDLVCLLVPSRTDTKWFHELVFGVAEVRFIRGRIKFGGSKNNAPFPSMLCIFSRDLLSEFDQIDICHFSPCSV